jgi:hypothetical protein
MRLIDRRDFMKAAGLAFAASLSPRRLHAMQQADAVFATAYQIKDGPCGVAVLSEDRKVLFTSPLPDRGHDVTYDPLTKCSVIFARRPGTFAIVFDHTGAVAPTTITSPTGRHFFGHGVFSPDGKLLYATENDYENAAGTIGIYDATNGFARIGEFPTHGMDPHEMLLLGDGRTLAIANGGIETHPDFGRAKLNLSTMKPSLVFVDRITGDLIERHEQPPELHQLSIRHMAVDHTGAVWFGCQHEGPSTERPALVGRARAGESFGLIEMPQDVLAGLRNYVGSIAANAEAGTIAVSSPQGNALVIIEAAAGRIVSTSRLAEVCGIAPDRSGFLATTGAGEIVDPDGGAKSAEQYAWDNHLSRIG